MRSTRCNMRLAPFAAMFMLVVGCGGGSTGPTNDGSAQSGLQYDGAIALPWDASERVELSAPLFPDSRVFQQFQDASAYPALSSGDRLALVDDDVRTFEELLSICAETHPAIELRAEGDPPLTTAELRTNYDEV